MREKLNRDFCERVTRAGYHADGGGLYLNVKKDGRKYWCYRWRDRYQRYPSGKSAGLGKLREKGLGRAGEHDISLEEARKLAGECRKLVRMGLDPIMGMNWNSSITAAGSGATLTFADCTRACIETLKPRWGTERQANSWQNSLEKHASSLMPLPVTAIDEKLVLACLQPLWIDKTETAMRVRQRVETVLNWAIEHGHRRTPNPARWRGNFDQVLPRPSRVKRTENGSTMRFQEVPALYRELEKMNTIAARALQLQVLTAARPGEVIKARWDEFKTKGAVWIIPGSRTANGTERTIPLSPPALDMLKNLPRNDEFVFPGRDCKQPMSTAAGMKLLRSLHPGATQMALRRAFHDWVQSETEYSAEVVSNMAGSRFDTGSDPARLRSDIIAGTTRLMKDWANYCRT